MAKPVFKHQDDDGDLSIFASGDVVVLACEHGHYWLVDAKQHSNDSIKPALRRSLTRAEAVEMFKAL
jgi:hypothetical protein